ncbi:MAG TPA: response regulator [Spirochaetota bacterium]|nr:response regulator [Spirochaetota bacterium]HPC40304.1 response regulator [Spirochaetota bacterium]HPL15347.1 response regulator [Spirochaetota bacterium]HQF07222.1 response regulator [Spirochaetota bacterium]HQH96122.1 response regulator [Spirochaetota bacterium]
MTEAEDAGGALSRFNSDGGNFDLLLSDVVLPGKNGIRLAEELTALNPRLKVLLCSGYTGQRSQMDGIMERNYPFLQKPYSMNDLLPGVSAALRGN